MNAYYVVTVVSPAGFRDTYGIDASGPGAARVAVAGLLAKERPLWRAVSAMPVGPSLNTADTQPYVTVTPFS
jgi:hypothetical protein